MKKIVFVLWLCLVIPVMAGINGAPDEALTTDADILPASVGITIGDDWFTTVVVPPAFYWGGGTPAPSDSGPFTFSNSCPVWLDVTDDFCQGDQFEIFDWGVSIGTTSAVASEYPGCSPAVGPEAAFNDPNSSSGRFLLGPGDHSIDVNTIVNPWAGGRGYIRVLDATMQVAVDIKPTSCPNPLNTKSKGVLPVAILGTDELDVTTIDAASVMLAGVSAIRSNYEDVATPVSDPCDCICNEEGPDGYLDLTLKFATQEIVDVIGDVNHKDVLELPLTGVFSDGICIEGMDCITIRGQHRSPSQADLNQDGTVSFSDMLILFEEITKGRKK